MAYESANQFERMENPMVLAALNLYLDPDGKYRIGVVGADKIVHDLAKDEDIDFKKWLAKPIAQGAERFNPDL